MTAEKEDNPVGRCGLSKEDVQLAYHFSACSIAVCQFHHLTPTVSSIQLGHCVGVISADTQIITGARVVGNADTNDIVGCPGTKAEGNQPY